MAMFRSAHSLEEFYRTNYDAMKSLIVKIYGQQNKLDDIADYVLFKFAVSDTINKFDPTRGCHNTYYARCIKNFTKAWMMQEYAINRKETHDRSSELITEDYDTIDQIVAKDLIDKFESYLLKYDGISELTIKVWFYWKQGFSLSEISKALNAGHSSQYIYFHITTIKRKFTEWYNLITKLD